jgi:5'-nucleotidase
VTRDDIKFENGENQVDFSFAGKMLNKITKIVLKKGLPEGIDILNVNVPENPSDEEFEIAQLSERMYIPVMDKRLDPRGKPYYWIGGEPYANHKPGSDGYALHNLGKTTITPIKIDQTSDIDSLHEWLE